MSVGLEWAEWGFCKCYKQAGIVLNKKGIETKLFNGAHAEATEPLMLPNGFGSEHIGSALPMTEVDGGVEGDALERTVLIFANGVGCKAVGLGIVGTVPEVFVLTIGGVGEAEDTSALAADEVAVGVGPESVVGDDDGLHIGLRG